MSTDIDPDVSERRRRGAQLYGKLQALMANLGPDQGAERNRIADTAKTMFKELFDYDVDAQYEEEEDV